MKAPRRSTPAELKRHPLPPVEEGDKNSHGRLLVIAGTRDIAGAAMICATAAMRAGCGQDQHRDGRQRRAAARHGGARGAWSSAMAEARDGGFARSAVADSRAAVRL